MNGHRPGKKNRLLLWTVAVSLLSLAMGVTFFQVGSAQTPSNNQYRVFLPVIYKQYSPGLPTPTPTPTPSPPTPTPTPTPIPCDVQISSYRLLEYDDRWGFHYLAVVGELNNLSAEWSYWLTVRFVLFDSEGFVVLSETTSAFYEPLPGDYTWFKFNIWNPPVWASYELLLEICWPDPPPDYPNLTVSEVSTYIDEYNVFHVAGVVTNDDSVGAYPEIGVGFYDGTGDIWQADYTLSVPYLRPGDKARFDIAVWGPVEGYASYEVRAW